MKKKLMGIVIFILVSINAFAIKPGIDGHKSGDIIAVKTDDEIVAWCDFGKQIVTTQFNVLCVYNGNKKSPSDL